MARRDRYALTGRGRAKVALAAVAVALATLTAFATLAFLYLVLRALLERLVSTGGFLLEGTYRVPLLASLLAVLITQMLAYAATHSLLAREGSVLRLTLAGRLRKLPLPFFDKHQVSDLVAAVISDADLLERAWVQVLGQLMGAVLSAMVLALGLTVLNWQMAVASLWPLPFALLLIALSNRYGGRGRSRARSARASMEASFQGIFENARELRASNRSADFVARFDAQANEWERREAHVALGGGMLTSLAQALMRLGLATALLFGAAYVRSGALDFLTFFVYLLAASRVCLPFDEALGEMHELFLARDAAVRVKRVLDEPIVTGEHEFKPRGHDIEFDHVSFAFVDSAEPERDVLHDVSFVACDGEVTALVGPSGAGKSTCARLAMRDFDVRTGAVRVGGVDVASVDPEVLLRVYATVFQDVTLFDDTVLENIRFGRPGATDDEVREAAKAACCDEFVERLPHGYATRIGENGARLSGGERQRISIARAILKDAPIVLLDEATASLDVGNETQVQTALSHLLRGKTVLVIAHRMRTVARADKIVVLDRGKVVEQGTPGELLVAGGTYARMAYLQALDAESKAAKDEPAGESASPVGTPSGRPQTTKDEPTNAEAPAFVPQAPAPEAAAAYDALAPEAAVAYDALAPEAAAAYNNVAPEAVASAPGLETFAPKAPASYDAAPTPEIPAPAVSDDDDDWIPPEWMAQRMAAANTPVDDDDWIPPEWMTQRVAGTTEEQAVTEEPAAKEVSAAPTADPSYIVYVRVLGKSKTYHRDGCDSLRKTKVAVRLCDASRMGLKPCKHCFPPKL